MTPIDWSQPQPEGTYRCINGWEAGGLSYGCENRGIHESADKKELYCTSCALLGSVGALRVALEEPLRDIAINLSDHNRSMDELYAILWYSRPWWWRRYQQLLSWRTARRARQNGDR